MIKELNDISFAKEIFDFSSYSDSESEAWRIKTDKPIILHIYTNYKDCCMDVNDQSYIARMNMIFQETKKEYPDEFYYYKLESQNKDNEQSLILLNSYFPWTSHAMSTIVVMPKVGLPILFRGPFPRSAFKETIEKIIKEGK